MPESNHIQDELCDEEKRGVSEVLTQIPVKIDSLTSLSEERRRVAPLLGLFYRITL